MKNNDKKMVKTLYVSDLDGTLLDDSSQLSAGTIATLNRIIGELGGLFTIATARYGSAPDAGGARHVAVHRHWWFNDVESCGGEL